MRSSNAAEKIAPAQASEACASTRAAQDFANSPAMQILRKLAGGESAKIKAADAQVSARGKTL